MSGTLLVVVPEQKAQRLHLLMTHAEILVQDVIEVAVRKSAAEKTGDPVPQFPLSLWCELFHSNVHDRSSPVFHHSLTGWQVVSRVSPLTVDAHLKVQVRTGGASGVAGEGNDVARLHGLSHPCQQFRTVTVERGEPVAVVDAHVVAVAADVVLGDGHCSRQRRSDRRSRGDSQIHAGVSLRLVGDRVDAVAEFRGDAAFPSSPDGGAEAVRTNEGNARAGYPAICSGGDAVADEVVDAVGIAFLLLCDLHVQDDFDVPIPSINFWIIRVVLGVL